MIAGALAAWLAWRALVYLEAERDYTNPPGALGTLAGILIPPRRARYADAESRTP